MGRKPPLTSHRVVILATIVIYSKIGCDILRRNKALKRIANKSPLGSSHSEKPDHETSVLRSVKSHMEPSKNPALQTYATFSFLFFIATVATWLYILIPDYKGPGNLTV